MSFVATTPVAATSVADKIASTLAASSVADLIALPVPATSVAKMMSSPKPSTSFAEHQATSQFIPKLVVRKKIAYGAGLLLLFLANIFCRSDLKVTNAERIENQNVSRDQLPNTDMIPPLEDTVKPDLLDSTQYVMGKFEPSTHVSFIKIPLDLATREGMYLRKEAYEAFQKMAFAAKKENVNLKIVSATRNFKAQKMIWDRKWRDLAAVAKSQNIKVSHQGLVARAQKIMEYSSMPGTSRHHWGTDIDLNALDNAYFSKGEGKNIYHWLSTHAFSYGFCQPYTENRPSGYKEEKWHWTYMPISRTLTDFCARKLTNNLILGFEGAATAEAIDVVKKYQLEINPACK